MQILPCELYALIAEKDPMVAIRLHTVSRSLKRMIEKHVRDWIQTRFIGHAVHGLWTELESSQLVGMLYRFFGAKMRTPCHEEQFHRDVEVVKKQASQFGRRRMWLYRLARLMKDKLETAEGRSYLLRVVEAVGREFSTCDSSCSVIRGMKVETRLFALRLVERFVKCQFALSLDSNQQWTLGGCWCRRSLSVMSSSEEDDTDYGDFA